MDPKNIALGMIVVWAGYIALNNTLNKQNEPSRRKHKQGLTANHIDHQIDQRNRVHGGKVPANLDVPFYSRHNYSRRRRQIHT